MKVSCQPHIPLMLAMLVVSGCSDVSDKEALKFDPFSCALLVARTIEDTTGRALAMAKIADKHTEAGQQEQALQLLSGAIEIAKTNTWPDFRLRCTIAGKYAKAGDFDQALKTAATIEDAWSKSRAWVDIAGKYIEIKEADKATQLLTQAHDTATTAVGEKAYSCRNEPPTLATMSQNRSLQTKICLFSQSLPKSLGFFVLCVIIVRCGVDGLFWFFW